MDSKCVRAMGRWLVGAAALGLALGPALAWAWGSEGHRIVAAVAEARLSPAARKGVADLLALEPGASLESISTWADEVKAPSTARWHYVNIARGAACSYDAARDCPDGQCVVEAIRRQAAVLSSQAPAAERLKALKYVVHLVADAHQPLHAGFADDKGGNLYQVQAFGRGTNLHAVWDSGSIEAWPKGVAGLRAEVLEGDVSGAVSLEPERWAEESCKVVAQPWFYPDRHRLDGHYVAEAEPVLKLRLALAGRRLAMLLNDSLGSK